jgi:quinol monooxygenase YgiN
MREINEMATTALLVRLEAKPGKESAVEEFLLSALPLVEQEPGTKPWFAIRFGPCTFGVIDAFPDDAARKTHLDGPVGKALAEKADELFASPPTSAISTASPTSSDRSGTTSRDVWRCGVGVCGDKCQVPRCQSC